MTAISELIHTRKHFGPVVALDDVSLAVQPGEVLALLGPNGAGKSTAISLLVGLRRPDAGSATLFGRDPTLPAARGKLGVTPQQTGFPDALRVGELVGFACAHFANALPVGEVLARYDLADLARRQVGGLSGGQRRRLAVALAFAGQPELAVLDEPTAALDIETRHQVWDGIEAFVTDGGTVLLSTHDMTEVERLASRVVVMARGRVIADDTVANVRRLVKVARVSWAGDPPPAAVERDAVSVATFHDRHVVVTPESDEVVRALVADAVPFTDLEVAPASLEDAFLELTAQEKLEVAS